MLATPLGNRYTSHFVFTWPLTLVAVQQLALMAVSRPKTAERDKKIDWIGFAAVGFMVLICVLYFKLTRQLSLAPAWYFLVTLPAAWPLAVPAARRFYRSSTLATAILWMLIVFSAYFWVAGGIMLLRTAYS